MAAVTICSDFGAPAKKSLSPFPLFPHLFAMKWWDWMTWSSFFECSILNQLFHSPLSPSPRSTIVPLYFFAVKVVSSAYLRFLVFLPAVLILACDSPSPAFRIMYCAYKSNKQGDNIQPWCTPFPNLNQSIALCPVLTMASCPAYRFLRGQVRQSGIPISLRVGIFITQLVVIHIAKGFSIVNE